MSSETKVGLFFVLGLVLLAAFTLKLEDVRKAFGQRYMLKTVFQHASGLEVGDPVAVIGVNAGVVKALTLVQGHVEVDMEIRTDCPIYPGSKATIEWSGLLGRKYIDLTVGDMTQPRLRPGSEIPSQESASIGAVMDKIETAASKIADLVGSGDAQSMMGKINKALDGMVQISEDLKNGTGTVGKLFASDELYNKLNGIADQIDTGAKSFNGLAAKLDTKIGPILDDIGKATPDLKSAIDSIQQLAARFKDSQGTIPKLMDNPEMYDKLSTIVNNLTSFSEGLKGDDKGVVALLHDEKFAENLRTAAADLREVTQMLKEGQGTVPRLLRDDDIYRQIKKLLADAQEAIRGVQEQIPVGTFAGLLFSQF